MTEPLSHSHDRFFKEIFSRQENARSFLQHYLPPEIAPLLDFSTLEISKDSFIDSALQEHLSDLLYKVTLHEGAEAHIYILRTFAQAGRKAGIRGLSNSARR